MLIGLSGKMGAGKDTLAQYLIDNYRYERYAFADHLKETAAFMTGLPLHFFNDRRLKEQEAPGLGASPRKILEVLGTEVGRNIDPDFWVKRLMHKLAAKPGGSRIIITDMRFPNEYEAIRRAGGFAVRVKRKETDEAEDQSTHISNTALDTFKFDAVVNNDYDLDMLRALSSFLLTDLEDAAWGRMFP